MRPLCFTRLIVIVFVLLACVAVRCCAQNSAETMYLTTEAWHLNEPVGEGNITGDGTSSMPVVAEIDFNGTVVTDTHNTTLVCVHCGVEHVGPWKDWEGQAKWLELHEIAHQFYEVFKNLEQREEMNRTHVPKSWMKISEKTSKEHEHKSDISNWTFQAPCGEAGNVTWKSWSMEPTCRKCISWLRSHKAEAPPKGVKPQ